MITFYSLPFSNLWRIKNLLFIALIILLTYNYLDIPLAQLMVHYEQHFVRLCKFIHLVFNGKCILPSIVLLTVLTFFIKPLKSWRNWCLALLVCLVVGQCCLVVLKPLIGRARPYVVLELGHHLFRPLDLDNQYFSFPSGHTINIMLIFGFLSLRYSAYRVLWIILGLGLSLIRVVDGSHFLSDCMFTAYFALSLIPLIRYLLEGITAIPYIRPIIQGFEENK